MQTNRNYYQVVTTKLDETKQAEIANVNLEIQNTHYYLRASKKLIREFEEEMQVIHDIGAFFATTLINASISVRHLLSVCALKCYLNVCFFLSLCLAVQSFSLVAPKYAHRPRGEEDKCIRGDVFKKCQGGTVRNATYSSGKYHYN